MDKNNYKRLYTIILHSQQEATTPSYTRTDDAVYDPPMWHDDDSWEQYTLRYDTITTFRAHG